MRSITSRRRHLLDEQDGTTAADCAAMSSRTAPIQLTWDRGTLLLDGPSDIAELPGVTWDPRVRRWRAPAYLHAPLIDTLQATGGEVIDASVLCEPVAVQLPAPPLRPYQEAALMAWQLAERRGVIVLPTGAGKTRTALAAIASTQARTLCLVPTRVLLDQWCAVIAEAGLSEFGRYGDGDARLGPITVATYASANRHAEDLGRRFELVVVDECHHFGGLGSDECLEMCAARWRLGLTATPEEDPARRLRLEALIGPVVYRSHIEDLTGRFLAPLRHEVLSLALSPGERRSYDVECALWRPVVHAFFEVAPGAAWGDFVRAAQRTDTGRQALVAWRRTRALTRLTTAKRAVLHGLLQRHAASRVLVFATDAVTAHAIARAELVPVITADIGRSERRAILEAFARGETRVIASARVLNEGVDVPSADVAIVIGGGHGEREHVQRIGRVLRPAPGKEAMVYELVTHGTHEVAQFERRRRGLVAA